jgi:hypothetical protein
LPWAALAVLASVPVAEAKEFGPGELRACNATHCVIVPRSATAGFSAFLYGNGSRPGAVRAPDATAPGYEIRFVRGNGSGPVGLVGGVRRDRMRVYGLNCGRFERGRWYALPPALARALQIRTRVLAPLRIGPAPRSC